MNAHFMFLVHQWHPLYYLWSQIGREWGKDGIVIRETEHIRIHLWQIYSVTINLVTTVDLLKWWIQRKQQEPLLAVILYQWNQDMNHKLI